jgi:DNA-binding ferritin-like protein
MAKRSTQKVSKRKHNKTMRGGRPNIKKGKPTNQTKSRIVKTFMELLTMVKLYHWKTRSYAKHKATDKLYESLNDHIDDFVEIMLGKDQSRIKMVEKRIDLLDASSNGEFKQHIHEYREFLIDLSLYFDAKLDSDLLNSRDEILGDINQFLYLLSFDK